MHTSILTLFHPYIVLFPQRSRQIKIFFLSLSWYFPWPHILVLDVFILLTHIALKPMHGQIHGRKPRHSTLAHHDWAALLKPRHEIGIFFFLVGLQELQDLAHLRHPDHQECSPIRSTFFSNPPGIEEQALFLWAQQYTPASTRPQTLVGFYQVFQSTLGTMGSWHARGLVRDSQSRFGW